MNERRRFNFLISEIDNVFHDTAVRLGLSDSTMAILYTICNNGESCLLRDIACMTGISKQTINSGLRKLEAEGIVYLENTDRKRKRVFLTEKGNLLADQTVALLIRIEDEIYASWTEEERIVYLELTQRYLDQMKEKTRGLGK